MPRTSFGAGFFVVVDDAVDPASGEFGFFVEAIRISNTFFGRLRFVAVRIARTDASHAAGGSRFVQSLSLP